jgi:hypothetical protein
VMSQGSNILNRNRVIQETFQCSSRHVPVNYSASFKDKSGIFSIPAHSPRRAVRRTLREPYSACRQRLASPEARAKGSEAKAAGYT